MRSGAGEELSRFLHLLLFAGGGLATFSSTGRIPSSTQRRRLPAHPQRSCRAAFAPRARRESSHIIRDSTLIVAGSAREQPMTQMRFARTAFTGISDQTDRYTGNEVLDGGSATSSYPAAGTTGRTRSCGKTRTTSETDRWRPGEETRAPTPDPEASCIARRRTTDVPAEHRSGGGAPRTARAS